MHKERYVKLRNTIDNIFEGTTEELNAHIQSYDSLLKEKNKEITEVQLKMLIKFLTTFFYARCLRLYTPFKVKAKLRWFYKKSRTRFSYQDFLDFL